MKLSEAIRLGAMMAPQAYFLLETTVSARPSATLGLDRSYTATCALGAAMQAVGLPRSPASIETFYATFPALTFVLDQPCPVCGREGAYGTVQHLNNDHRWSRERIAAWVATVEPADVSVAPRAPAEAVSA